MLILGLGSGCPLTLMQRHAPTNAWHELVGTPLTLGAQTLKIDLTLVDTLVSWWPRLGLCDEVDTSTMAPDTTCELVATLRPYLE